MTDAPNTPPAPPAVTPHLVVDNAVAAVEFYKQAFGAVEVDRQVAPDGKRLLHAALLVRGGLLMLCDDFPEFSGRSRTPRALGGSPITIHLDLPDVDATWATAVAAGATVAMPLADQFWGDRYGKLVDPFGHEWSLGTRKHTPSQAERDHGAAQSFAKSS